MAPKCVLTAVTLLTLVRISVCVPTRQKRTSNMIYTPYGANTHCEIGDQIIPHGEVFSVSRCLQYQCVYGTGAVLSEGCEGSDERCHEVGDDWEEHCIRYTCTRTDTGVYDYFQPIVQNVRCQDVYGQCHELGEFFSYRLQGRLHQNCRCNITERNIIFYRCY